MSKIIIYLVFFSASAIGVTGGGSTQPPSYSKKWHEADYVDHNCKGELEYILPDRTRVDCLTDTHAIEYDYSHKWAESIGQSLYYSAMTGKKAGIVLIVDPADNGRYLKRLNKAIKDKCLQIDVSVINIHDKNNEIRKK